MESDGAADKAAFKIKVKFGGAVIGPGKIALLRLIEEEGGISAAARGLGLTYRRAWHLIDTLNQAAGQPVVETSVGGAGGGGARLTKFGGELVRRYEEAVAKIDSEGRDLLEWLDSERSS